MNNRLTEYHKGKRFSTYELGYGDVQLRDNSIVKGGAFHRQKVGIVAVFPTCGGQYATSQDYKRSVRFARNLCRILNSQAPETP